MPASVVVEAPAVALYGPNVPALVGWVVSCETSTTACTDEPANAVADCAIAVCVAPGGVIVAFAEVVVTRLLHAVKMNVAAADVVSAGAAIVVPAVAFAWLDESTVPVPAIPTRAHATPTKRVDVAIEKVCVAVRSPLVRTFHAFAIALFAPLTSVTPFCVQPVATVNAELFVHAKNATATSPTCQDASGVKASDAVLAPAPLPSWKSTALTEAIPR